MNFHSQIKKSTYFIIKIVYKTGVFTYQIKINYYAFYTHFVNNNFTITKKI